MFDTHFTMPTVYLIYLQISQATQFCSFQAEEALGPISIPRGSRGVDPFRGLVPLGLRNLVPILPPAHPL
jgi:hypothetical protein